MGKTCEEQAINASSAWNRTNSIIQQLGGSGKRRMIVALKRLRTGDGSDSLTNSEAERQEIFDVEKGNGHCAASSGDTKVPLKSL